MSTKPKSPLWLSVALFATLATVSALFFDLRRAWAKGPPIASPGALQTAVQWRRVGALPITVRVTALIHTGTALLAGTENGRVFRSTNNGASWTTVSTAASPKRINAFTLFGSSLIVGGIHTEAGAERALFYRSTNDGVDWSAISGLSAIPGQTVPLSQVGGGAQNGAAFFVGANGVQRSTDNLASWSTVSTNFPCLTNYSGYRCMATGMTVRGTDVFASIVYSTNVNIPGSAQTLGAIYRSENNGDTWRDIEDGLARIQINAILASGSNVFAGTPSSLFKLAEDNSRWDPAGGVPLQGAKVLALANNGANFYTASNRGVHLSTDNGVTATRISDGLPSDDVSAITGAGANLFAGNGLSVYVLECGYALSAANQSVAAAGGDSSVNLTAVNAGHCAWAVRSAANWITVTSASSGMGNATINYTAAANPTTSQRTGTILIAGQSMTVTQAPGEPPPVISSLSPSSATAGGAAFTLTVVGTNFVNGSVVRWNESNRTTSFVSGTQLTAQIPANDIAAAGTATVTVFNPASGALSNSLTLTICSFALSSSGQSFSANSGTGSVTVTTPAGCAWTASSNASWIAITSGASGSGNGTVGYSVAINTGTTSRSGTMTIAGQTFTVSQTAANSLAVVSNASFSAANGLAPESIVGGFGTGLATTTTTATSSPWPTTLGGTTVKVRDVNGTERLSPLSFVSPSQIAFQIPPGTVVGAATVIVTSSDGTVSIASVQITTVGPGLFSKNGTGQGVADGLLLRIKSDGSQVSESISRFDSAQSKHVPVPIDFGPAGDQLFLILLGTGFRGRSSLSATSMKIGGTDVPIAYAGAQGSLAGYDQVNGQLPRSLSGRGVLDIIFTVDGKTANTVQVAFQPSVTSISPAAPTASSSSQNITVNGLGFQSGLTVTLTSPSNVTTTLSGAQIQSVSATSFVANATLNAAGTWSFRVNNPDGGQTNTFSFTVNSPANPVPALTSISPSAATAGSAAFTLTVNGSGFVSGSVVRWNGNSRTTSFISSAQLTAQIPASDIATSGTASVTALNPTPGGGTSNALTFTINACTYLVSPASQSFTAAGGSGSAGVTAGSGCSWTATSNTSWVTITSGGSSSGNGSAGFSVAVNASSSSRTGTMTIAGQTFTVTQSGGQSLAAVSAASFSTTNGLAPESVVASFGTNLATSVSVASSTPLPTTLGGSTVTVQDATGADRLSPLFFVSSGQINFQVPAGTSTGVATIIVRSASGGISVGNVQISQVAPGFFSRRSTGQGAAFGNALRIQGDGSQSSELLSEADGTARTINLGPPSDQVYLILRGTGFRNRSSLANILVKIGGVDASVTYAGPASEPPFAVTPGGVGEDQLNVLVPRSLAGRGLVDIVATIDGKTMNTVQVSIGTATAAPAVASISPATPTASSSSQSIIVNGTSFQAGLSVTLTSPSGSAATLSGAQIQSVTATSFVMLATLNFTGIWNLRVNNSDGGQSNIFNFTVGTNCTYSINPTSQSFVAAGGTGSVVVTADSGCGWTATSNAAWMSVTSGASGNGIGTVNYTVAVNTGAARSGTITIAGQTFTVTQGCTDTAITSPPVSQAVCPGSPVSFSVTATGAGTLSYQWRKNTISIPGATGSTFTIPSAVAGDAGAYSVVVTGACDSVTSSAVTLTINSLPSVTTQPVNQSVTVGGSATFTAAASGVPAPSLQWQVSTDGVSFNNVSGATSATLTLSNVTLAQNGNRYRAVFTNSCGTATSNPATLNVNCPAINLSPTTLRDGSTGAPYSETLTANGGVGTSRFSISAGALPTGLSLTTAGVLSGTPTQGGTFNFTITVLDANNCPGSRAYTLLVACAFDISPKSQSFGASGGDGGVSVLTGGGCGWAAISNAAWIAVTGGANGTGNGSVGYSVAANTGTSQRVGTMTIAGLTFTVTQAGVNPNPTPVISSLSPSSIAAGSAAVVLTVNGSNFVGGAVVRLNGNDRQTNFVNASQLTAQIPATDLAAASSAQITVVNPAPGGGASNVSVLTITPVVSGFTLSGRITYSDVGRPVPGAVVTSSAPGTTPISSPPSGSNGFYSISGLAAGNYIITPSKSGNVNGITAFDAARIMQRLAAGDPFAGIQRRAADVDGNDIINVGDALRIANYIVGAPDVGQVGKWTFDRESRIAGVIGNLTDQDFQAALIGDVTRTWLPDNSLAITTMAPLTLNLRTQATGEELKLPGVMINGVGFAPGLTLVVMFPEGGEMRLRESQILDIKPDSFTALVGLPGPGLWALRVINPDGRSSDVFVVRIEK